MAMNKKEKEYVESLETLLAFRMTGLSIPKPDVILSEEMQDGWVFNGYDKSIRKVCSSRYVHARGLHAKELQGKGEFVKSHGGTAMYSKASLAARAMRVDFERICALELRKIDIKIAKLEQEEGKESNGEKTE